jgi:hypothetical protein
MTIYRLFEPDSALQYWADAPSERDARNRVLKQIPTLSEGLECRTGIPDLVVPYGVVVVSKKTKE